SDLQLRRLPLYPTELRARWGGRSYAPAPGASIYEACSRTAILRGQIGASWRMTMSKQDTHFFNVFSMVIGLLVAVAVGLFALARAVASHTQDLQVLSEIDYGKAVAARLQPPSAEAVSGQDNSALAIKPEGPAAGAAGT